MFFIILPATSVDLASTRVTVKCNRDLQLVQVRFSTGTKFQMRQPLFKLILPLPRALSNG